MRVAAIQMISGPDLQENLHEACQLIRKAVALNQTQLVLLPEYFCLIGANDQAKLQIAESFGDGPIQQTLSELARELHIYLIAGTLPLSTGEPNRVYNATLVFNPQGEVIARYDKIHLFRFTRGAESYDEARTLKAGDRPVKVDCGGIGVGLSVCYDLRFPELYRSLQPLDLIVMPAAFTHTTGMAHWEVLIRARAIENQCYVLASGQGGLHLSGRRTFGHSMLVDPWGEVVQVLAEGAGIVHGEVSPAKIAEVRSQLPALNHRVL